MVAKCINYLEYFLKTTGKKGRPTQKNKRIYRMDGEKIKYFKLRKL